MRGWGFTPELVARYTQQRVEAERTLRQISADNGWNLGRGKYFPSMAALSRKTNSLDIYRLLYHATSRSVHFSGSELLRRAWGDAKSITISYQHQNDYWSLFALTWGWQLFSASYLE